VGGPCGATLGRAAFFVSTSARRFSGAVEDPALSPRRVHHLVRTSCRPARGTDLGSDTDRTFHLCGAVIRRWQPLVCLFQVRSTRSREQSPVLENHSRLQGISCACASCRAEKTAWVSRCRVLCRLPTRGRGRESAPGRSRETGVGESERDDRGCSPPGRIPQMEAASGKPKPEERGVRGFTWARAGGHLRALHCWLAVPSRARRVPLPPACMLTRRTRRRATRVLERSFRSGGSVGGRQLVCCVRHRHVETTGSRTSPD
jgi:hypothetical protein